MALRVLLADESTTIKKVMQLALQDFAVEVKAVHAGVDVLDVARVFKPDVIFADVLLQKKNGYEVCGILKADAELKAVPVVLMWSSFMDLDETQAKASGAEARLEKPFDVETLRKLVLDLVPKSRSQRLAHFLEYSPKLNEELQGDSRTPVKSKMATPPPVAVARPTPPPIPLSVSRAEEKSSTWSMESFSDPASFEGTLDSIDAKDREDREDLEEEKFKPFELSLTLDTPNPMKEAVTDQAAEDESWSRHDLSEFKLDLPPISVGEGRDEFNIDLGEQEFSQANFETLGADLTLDTDQIANAEHEVALPLEPFEFDDSPAPLVPQLSAERLEEIIRAQSREIIESVVRKMVPDLASAIIREELARLLEDNAVRDSR